MHNFKPSFYSNPGALEPATLVLTRPHRSRVRSRRNPATASTRYRWEGPDGLILEIDGTSYQVTFLGPPEQYGTTMFPGTQGYRAFIQAAIADWEKNATWWQANIDYPPEREVLEAALAQANAAQPERQKPVDKNGQKVDPPDPPKDEGGKINWPLIGAVALVGVAAIGAAAYFSQTPDTEVPEV